MTAAQMSVVVSDVEVSGCRDDAILSAATRPIPDIAPVTSHLMGL
jgi:hypothetical protein